MENVKVEDNGLYLEITAGYFDDQRIVIPIFHYVASGKELVGCNRSKKAREVADKIAEILKTIEL